MPRTQLTLRNIGGLLLQVLPTQTVQTILLLGCEILTRVFSLKCVFIHGVSLRPLPWGCPRKWLSSQRVHWFDSLDYHSCLSKHLLCDFIWTTESLWLILVQHFFKIHWISRISSYDLIWKACKVIEGIELFNTSLNPRLWN